MEFRWCHKKITVKDKTLTSLDRFVVDFVHLLKEYTGYVIVSGYPAIFFGRSRGTEDIDVLINPIDESRFSSFYQSIIKHGYYFLNPEKKEGLYEMLCEWLGIRIAKKNTIIPNIEIKFTRDDFDRFSLSHRVEVRFGNETLFFSPIEIQIPYKLYLGSDKDIEDAVYLWEIFKDRVDKGMLKRLMKELKVSGEIYGIVVR